MELHSQNYRHVLNKLSHFWPQKQKRLVDFGKCVRHRQVCVQFKKKEACAYSTFLKHQQVEDILRNKDKKYSIVDVLRSLNVSSITAICAMLW